MGQVANGCTIIVNDLVSEGRDNFLSYQVRSIRSSLTLSRQNHDRAATVRRLSARSFQSLKSMKNSNDIIEWQEHEVHEGVTEEEVAHLNLFEASCLQPFEMHSFQFPNMPPLSLRGHTEYPHATGLALWRGAEILAEYLVEHADLVKGKQVLELGSGMGLVGIVAHYLGADNVILTDGDSKVLENLQYNINQLEPCDTISCRQLIWGKDANLPKQNVILAADCLYMIPSVKPFWKTVATLLNPTGMLIYVMVSSSQMPFEQVVQIAKENGLDVETDDAPVYIFQRRQTLTVS
jgi:2-polyprenyl-3-methyl-5-hydroxy-6-metoxy-1,4-benzoquinol methylase